MAAHITLYPTAESEAFVRGDPAAFIVRIKIAGVDQDVSTWEWRCHVRAKFDSADPISVCESFQILTPDDLPEIFEDGGSTESVVVANFTGAQTALWKAGMVADLEELDPAKYTWVIFDALAVDKDATHTVVLP